MPIGGQPTMRAFYGCEVTYPFVALQVLDAADSVHASLPNKYCDPKIAANLYHETLDEYLVADTVFRQIIDFQRKAGPFGNLNIIGRSGFLTHAEAVKGIKMFAREVLPRLDEAKAEVHQVA